MDSVRCDWSAMVDDMSVFLARYAGIWVEWSMVCQCLNGVFDEHVEVRRYSDGLL